MFFQEAPAETTGYMIFGYSVIFGTILIYLTSLMMRWKNYQKDQEAFQDLETKK